MPPLELLVNLGLPSAIVGMVLIAVIFKRTHAKISAWAASIAVGLGGLFGAVQLVDIITGKDVTIRVEPSDAQAFTASGRPVELEIDAMRGAKVVATRRLEKLSERSYRSRPLVLGQLEGLFLGVEYQDFQLGVLDHQRLRDAGWHLAADCGNLRGETAGEPKFWHTNRVHAGETYNLGSSQYGIVKIKARSFTRDGTALVTLTLGGHGQPRPAEVEIPNKGLEVQSFAEVPEFYIALREADFKTRNPWAAFSVFAKQ
jgi:hypothetical protein